MARIIRFEPNQVRPSPGSRRYPRFDEVQGEIETTAVVRLGAAVALGEACRLFQRLREGASPEVRDLLNRLDEVLLTARKQHEHAAYLVGLKAATFRLDHPPSTLADDRSAPLGEPERGA
jgi:hypothetical protein